MRSRLSLAAVTLASTLTAQAPSAAMAQAVAAYAAKVTASAVFVSGRTVDSVFEQEFAPVRPLDALVRPLLRIDVDRARREVTCRLGVARATAVHHEGLGCSLLIGPEDPARRRYARPLPRFTPDMLDAQAAWPRGPLPSTKIPARLDQRALDAALDLAFAEPNPKQPVFTRAVVVAVDGRLVAERYADGFDAEMALPGWSMSKTLTNALVGAHVARGAFDVHGRPTVSGWREEGDGRAQVQNRHLLAMTAGLQWSEDYEDPTSDALRMLLGSRDHGEVYAQQPLQTQAGAAFQYASGATNLLCRELRGAYPGRLAYWQMPARFFARVGMHTAVLETDPSGTFVGSSYCYASARDWAKLGLLFLQDGVMLGERILPEGWVARSTRPNGCSGGRYGWQVWLNADPDGEGPRERRWPSLPADLFHMDGHEGQYVVVSPSAGLVVVRLGCTKAGGFPLTAFLGAVHAALD